MKKILIALQIVLGFDFGYYSYKSLKIKYIVKSFYFIRCLVTCLTIFCDASMWVNRAIWTFILLRQCQHFINVLSFLLIRFDCTLYKFELEIEKIDVKMSYKGPCYVEKFKMLSLFLCYLCRLIIHTHFYTTSGAFTKSGSIGTVSARILYFVCDISFNTILILFTFLFYSISYRFMIFEENLRMGSFDNSVFCRKLYKSLADLTEKFKSTFEHVVSCLLVFSVVLSK